MKVVLAGGSGFIGQYIAQHFLAANHSVVVLTRNPAKARKKMPTSEIQWVQWDGIRVGDWKQEVEKADVLINLAGHPIAGLWTISRKEKIYHSRVKSALALTMAMKQKDTPPGKFIQISATGYYGNRGDEILTEDSSQGKGFLAAVVDQWEDASYELQNLGIPRILLRLGAVLGRDGGLLPVLMPSFRFFLGGMPDGGAYWFPWIHVKEIPLIIDFLIHHQTLTGVINGVAPEPVQFEEFCHTLGNVLKRPCWIKIPEFLFNLLPGHQGEEMVLVSQRVIPQRLVQAGYQFKYPTLYVALSEILGKQDVPVEPPKT